MDKIPSQIGYLVLKDDGAVLESGGDLENDERSANIIIDLLQLTESVDENFMAKSSCERISIVYEDHSYNICMSNRRIYIVKLRSTSAARSSIGSSNSNIVYAEADGGAASSNNSSTVTTTTSTVLA